MKQLNLSDEVRQRCLVCREGEGWRLAGRSGNLGAKFFGWVPTTLDTKTIASGIFEIADKT